MQCLEDSNCIRRTCHAALDIENLACEEECPALLFFACACESFEIEELADWHTKTGEECLVHGVFGGRPCFEARTVACYGGDLGVPEERKDIECAFYTWVLEG